MGYWAYSDHHLWCRIGIKAARGSEEVDEPMLEPGPAVGCIPAVVISPNEHPGMEAK